MTDESERNAPQPELSPWPGAAPRHTFATADPRLRSPVVATLLSTLPGLGQVYLGYYQQGFIHILVVGSVIALLAHDVGDFTPLLGIFLAFFWLYNMVDAGRRATMLNLVITQVEIPPLPDGFGTFSARGRLLGGLALVAVGCLALAHLRFGLSMAWLNHWWPAGLVLVGLYLVWQAAAERRN